MEDQKRNTDVILNVHENCKEVIVREGVAESPRQFQQKVTIAGVLNSPTKYFQKRKDRLIEKTCHLLVNREKQWIKLVVNEEDKHGAEIIGTLETSSYIKRMFINEDKQFNLTDMAQMLKKNIMFFADKSTESGESICLALVAALRNFSATINTSVADKSNDRGEMQKLFDRSVQNHNIPESFVLKIPVFKGATESEFKVEICFQVRDASISAWLESNELRMLQAQLIDIAINAEVSVFEESNIVVIEQ